MSKIVGFLQNFAKKKKKEKKRKRKKKKANGKEIDLVSNS